MKKIQDKNGKSTLLTPKYFLKEIHSFRKIVSSKEYTFEQKEKAFEGLMYVYVSVEDLDLDGPECMLFQATIADWEVRRSFEMIRGL
jgi:hypothetical protein